MIVFILGFIILVNSVDGEIELIHWIMLLGISAIVGACIKEYQKTSKIINDLHRYANINEVISRYGTPDDIQNYGDYTKYIFKRSTNGWGWFKYQVDKHHLLHEKAGYYKYTTILGKTYSIPAEKELNISISEVEYRLLC